VGPILLPLQYSFSPKKIKLQWKHPTHNMILWYLGNSLGVDNFMTSWVRDLKFTICEDVTNSKCMKKKNPIVAIKLQIRHFSVASTCDVHGLHE
jgi:hypothetical protein